MDSSPLLRPAALRPMVILALGLLLWPAASLEAQSKPKLSTEIAAVIERDGIDAAKRRFDELVPARADEYEVDLDGLGQLAMGFAQSGDMAGMQTISEMVGVASQYAMGQMMQSMPPGFDADAMQRAEEAQRRSDAEAARADASASLRSSSGANSREEAMRAAMGEPRDDLSRFVGQYGDPGAQGDTPRNLFAAVRCDGYLVAGATWGDAALWHLRSTSDTGFEMDDPFTGNTIRISFDVGPDGTPRSMAHNVDFIESPLPFLGALPEEWGTECIRPPGG